MSQTHIIVYSKKEISNIPTFTPSLFNQTRRITRHIVSITRYKSIIKKTGHDWSPASTSFVPVLVHHGASKGSHFLGLHACFRRREIPSKSIYSVRKEVARGNENFSFKIDPYSEGRQKQNKTETTELSSPKVNSFIFTYTIRFFVSIRYVVCPIKRSLPVIHQCHCKPSNMT